MPITKGAALYITNRGDFDVIFLAKPQNFDSFEIAERQENGTYIYTFRGNPRLFSAGMEGKKTYFFKQSNKLFIAFDKQTAAGLAEFVGSNPK